MLRIFSPLSASQKGHTTNLSAEMTKAASKQTYYTIRFLVDRELVPDAYRAYAYFRWLDDCIDAIPGSTDERKAFIHRQQSLLEAGYRGEPPGAVSVEEQMLLDMVSHDVEQNSGLQSYLRNMMGVMVFDVERRGRLISQAELSEYSRMLSTAVTDALHYFIGHHCSPPGSETRYLAVKGAHTVHMLRDTVEDIDARYFNVPVEYIQAHNISIRDVEHPAYRKWVRGRVKLARFYFRIGRNTIAQVRNWRCRLAGLAYLARFEWMARTIERDGYRLRAGYPERKNLWAGMWMVWRILSSLFTLPKETPESLTLLIQPVQNEEQR